jgi:hypothetical protein
MRPPRWDDPVGSACREAELAFDRGLPVRPTLYGFVDGEPVVRVQPGAVELRGDVDLAHQHLAVVPAVLGLEQVQVFRPVRFSDPDLDDEHLRDVFGTYGIAVGVGNWDGDEVVTEEHLVEREVVDGEVRWQPPHEVGEGLWGPLLRSVLSPPSGVVEGGLDPAVLAYGLSRAGTVLEVAPGWRQRFGMDRLRERDVRRVDRRRTRGLGRPRPIGRGRPASRAVSS